MVKNDVFARDRFVGRTFVDGKMFEQKEPARRPAAGAEILRHDIDTSGDDGCGKF